jgi:hypothetical protein
MSRKKNKRPEVLETGGLDLTKYANEPAIDVMASIGATPPLTAEVPASAVPVVQGNGLMLFQALGQSMLNMAARESGCEFFVVSNGQRFWTARKSDFEPIFVVGVPYNDDTERIRADWRPVVGNESGLRVG